MSNKQVYETKWGYVPYSYEDYKNLKQLNLIFQKARLNASRWKRWVRKAPHNRVKKEWNRNKLGQKIGSRIVGPLTEPMTCDLFSKKLVDVNRQPLERWFTGWIETDNTIELEYRKSRKPVVNQQEVENAKWSGIEIKNILQKAESWYQLLIKGAS